jgi:asparagine synthase (glutamine-hydrolysing)
MNHFAGRIARDGTLLVAGDAGPPHTPETHVDCRVLLRGRIADRPELARALGVDWAQRPGDAELLAHAYRKWGRGLQAHVLGEYAAVVFDARAGSGLITHDALGVAPLFYVERPEGFAFSTRLVDLLDAAACEKLDREYLADYLAAGHVLSDRTPYQAIKRLLPGMSVEWRGGGARHLRTWNLADTPAVRCSNNGEYEERFRGLLSAGVRAALDDVQGTAWVSLSGGLDSSSVACVSAKEGAPLGAFSLVHSSFAEADERHWMRAVVEQYGLPWHPLEVETVLPFTRLPDGFLGEPTSTVINAEYRRVTNELLSSRGVTALLTGHAGDGVLAAWPGPIPSHLADPLFSGRPLATLKAVAAWRAGCVEPRSWSYWMLRAVLAPAVSHLRGLQVRTAPRLPLSPWISPRWAKQMRLTDRGHRRLAPRCRHPSRQMLWDSLWGDSLSMSTVSVTPNSYEVRFPLLYRPLVEFMSAIPWEQKMRPRCDRYLQRRALKGVLPEVVRRRASKARGTWSLVEGLRRSKEWVQYLCDSPLMAEHGLADAEKWRQAVRQATVGQTHGDMYFMAGVAVEAWLKGLKSWLADRPPANSLPSKTF